MAMKEDDYERRSKKLFNRWYLQKNNNFFFDEYPDWMELIILLRFWITRHLYHKMYKYVMFLRIFIKFVFLS